MVCSATARSSPDSTAVGLPSTKTVTWGLPLTAIFPSAVTETSGVDCKTSSADPFAALAILDTS